MPMMTKEWPTWTCCKKQRGCINTNQSSELKGGKKIQFIGHCFRIQGGRFSPPKG